MQSSNEISKYLDIAARRRWWIILPFLVAILVGLTYALVAPRVYEAETLILVQPQKVPEDFVRSIVSSGVEDRLKTITQQVTSRTNLEEIIKEYGLLESKAGFLSIDDRVKLIKDLIKVDVTYRDRRRDTEANAFTISFQYMDANKAMRVANALASNFITENLRIRESQAYGTSNFLSDEMEDVKRRLVQKEDELKQYRERYMGELPEQLETNLAILERLQARLDQYGSSLRDSENRKLLVQKEIAAGGDVAPLPAAAPKGREDPEDLPSMKAKLASLETRYTAAHPDVIRLREAIAGLEAGQAVSKDGSSPEPVTPVSPMVAGLKRQLEEIDIEIQSLKQAVRDAEMQVKLFQHKIENTPKREQELLGLSRDYENLKELYKSLLNRSLEANIAVSLERKQQGEQFRVIDPAKVPTAPVKPDMKKVLLMTLALGLGLGAGLAYLVETMDPSLKMPEEVERELGLPVLVTTPLRFTERELRGQKIKRALAYVSTAVGFALSAAGIVLATKGVAGTLGLVKETLGRLGF